MIRVLRCVRSVFQHLHHLRPGAGGIGGELPAAGAIGDVLLIGPQHCIAVVGSGAHIREGCCSRNLGGAVGSPQESGHLRPGAWGVWGEFPVAGAAGDALFHSPQHRIIVVGIGTHIGEGIRRVYEEVLVPAGMGDVAIYTELGRFMMGPYGCLVTTAIHEKHTHKEYIGVDACAVDLMRPAMYGAYHHITVMGKEDAPHDHKYDVTGSLCENNDKFAIDRMLPEIEKGDYLVIHDTGAHGFAMGYSYNGKLKHAELLLKEDGSVQMIRRAERPADYFATFDCFDIGKKLIKN